MNVFPKWLLPAVVLLLIIPGSCRKESDPAKVFSSSEDEYLAALELVNEKQKNIYFQHLPDREENRLVREMNDERLHLAVLHASTSPTALSTVTNSCDLIPRQDVKAVYDALNPGMKKTNLGKAIKKHVDNKTVLVGDLLPHFEGVGLDGKPFDWSVTAGKRVLLIYEGWGWIKRSTHFWFKDLLAATDRDSLAVVTYVYADSMADLRKRVKSFQLDPYLVISDLKGKEGPLDKRMGIRGIPTYYYTDRQGRIRCIIAGFDEHLFTYYTGLSPQWGENWTDDND